MVGVPCTGWQGPGDIYCAVDWQGCTHRTQTATECSGDAAWSDLEFDIPLNAEAQASIETLKVHIMEENLVVRDKVIGTAEISLTSLFPGLQLPVQGELAPVSCTLTAYEGTRFKRKAKGTVTFSAEVRRMAANTRRAASTQPTPREKMEFRLDGDSMSVATRSIDPYATREGSTTFDAFSVAQLRHAADLLGDWEDPLPNTSRAIPPAAMVPPEIATKSASAKRGEVPPSSVSAVDAKPPVRPPRKSVAASTKTAQPSTAAVEQRSPSKPRSSFMQPKAKEVVKSTPTEASEPSEAAGKPAPPAAKKIDASKTMPVPQVATRVRERRTTALAATAGPGASAKSKPRPSSEQTPLPPRPNTDVVSIAGTGTGAGTSAGAASKHRFGNQAIDEAMRLALRKRGGFLKLTGQEFALLLESLLFPVRPALLQGAGKLSNLPTEGDIGTGTGMSGLAGKTGSGDAPKLEDVNLPIVHAMSLAATISFAIRDGDLLVSSEGRSATGLVTMSQGQSERALEQLQDLVVGPYPAIKACILALCVGSPPTPHFGVTSGRTSPALSLLTTGTSPALTRPSQWSTADVARLLQALHVAADQPSELDGAALLTLESAQLRTHFGRNPSIDRTRLAVYLQALKYADEWWDRGIRPTDVMATSAEGEGADPSLRKGGKGKRRGSRPSNAGAGAWGDLEHVWKAVERIEANEHHSQGQSKVVDGGRVVMSHLLKIADFQPLLEAMVPLNRAFGWGCSMESLVRFASIIGGMRGYAWMKPPLAEVADGTGQGGSNTSVSNLSQGSSVGGRQSLPFWAERADEGNSVAVWVALQKSSANSTTELTQLIRLCNELKVVMKYAPREDDFLVYIPVSCLRITSVAEIKAKRFDAELEGLLLEDLAVGKYVVVAGADALHRLCERFDWWDRPTAAVLDNMSGQIGEVVSLAEAADKRRVGVRLLNSGLCDALPLEGLRLCTVEEMRLVRQKVSVPEGLVDVNEDDQRPEDAAGVLGKSKRRKSKSGISDSRKTRLRTLIKSLNGQADDAPTEEGAKIQPAPAIARPPRAPTPPTTRPVKKPAAVTDPGRPAASEEGDNKSELSNLSADSDDHRQASALRGTPSKKQRKSLTTRPHSAAPTVTPTTTTAAGKAKPAPDPKSPPNVTAAMSPSQRVIKRVWVRNSPNAATAAVESKADDAFAGMVPGGDQSSSPVAQVPSTDGTINSELFVSTDMPADYSWLRAPKRSPLAFPEDVPDHSGPPPPTSLAAALQHQRDHPEQQPGSGGGKHSEVRRKAGPASLHIVQPSFDPANAEYADGVYKYDKYDDSDPDSSPQRRNADLRRSAAGAFQPKFVRHNRPRSAPSHGVRPKSAGGNNKAAPQSPPHNRDAQEALGIEGNNAHMMQQSSFGLAGVGYAAGGGLQTHANQWVNSDVAEGDTVKKAPSKQPLPRTDYKQKTQKLFDFHERQLRSPDRDAPAGPFMHGDFMLGGAAAPEKGPTHDQPKTVPIPPRPRSASATSRGVSSKSSTRLSSASGARAVAAEAEAEVLAKLDYGPAKDSAVELNIAGGAPPVSEVAGSSSKAPKRTRGEELQHIAAARSAKEVSLKVKVLMKELIRLQKQAPGQNQDQNQNLGQAQTRENIVI